jgi:DNA-binding transcriptional ArsR family regulator
MKSLPRTDPGLILHPIRARIVYAVEGRTMTPQQLAQEVPDVPQATLYRHIKKLKAAGVLVVAEERQVHGAVERTYRIDPSTVMIDTEKLASNKDKTNRYFEVYLSCLRQAFSRYTRQPRFDLKQDGIRFYSEFAFLSDEEQIALNHDIRELIAAAQRNAPARNRRRRCVSYIALPEPS